MSLCAMLATLPAMLLPFRSASAQSTGGYPGYPGTTTGGTTGGTTSGGTTTGYPGTTTGGTTSSGTTTGGTATTGTTGTPTPPAGSIHVIWNSDATTTPNVQQAATGGPVGDVGKVHVSFPIPTNAFSITLKELRIHEGAGHYSDTVASSPNIGDGTWSPLCGDPDPSQANAPQMQYYDVNWTITGCHNGPHLITATVEYLLYDPTNGNSTGPFDTPYQMSVDVENLLITSTNVNTNYTGTPATGAPGNSNTDNPTPIFWDPGSMTSVALSAPITAAYSSNCTVTLKIYGSDQSLVKTLTQTVGLGGLKTDPGPPPTSSIVSTTVSFTWDGTMDGGSSGAPAVKGIYLYQFNVSSLGGYDDYDQDKSSSLSFGSPALALTVGTADASGQNFVQAQTLQDSFQNPATSSTVDVYENWTLADVLRQKMSPSLGTTQTSLKVPPPSPGTVDDMVRRAYRLFLVSPIDADAAHDKGHRNRTALQHNQQHPERRLLTSGGYYPASVDKAGPSMAGDAHASSVGPAQAAEHLADTLGYMGWVVRSADQNGNPTPDQILYASWTTPDGVQCPHGVMAGCIDVAIFCGHGPGPNNAGTCFMFGTSLTDPNNDTDTFFMETNNSANQGVWQHNMSGSFDNTFTNGHPLFSSLDQLNHIWGSIWTSGQPVQLVIWAGCDTAADIDGAGMANNSVQYGGAACSVGLQTVWFMSDVQKFCQALSVHNMHTETVDHAVKAAVKTTRGHNDATLYYGIAGNANLYLPN